MSEAEKYRLTISRNTIDKLGVKLYDKAADVVSELVSNSYDADATEVRITIPLGEFLATRQGGTIKSRDLKIVVEDNGHGFSESQANDHYLKIGADRRKDPSRGPDPSKSRERGRSVMGRKGIGKLASFGICKTIEVWSASGREGQASHPVSNFILNYKNILQDTDSVYYPEPGDDDGTTAPERGTKITLSNFLYKKIPGRPTFMRQLSRKFGLESEDFKIIVTDSITGETRPISEMDIDLMEGARISVDERPVQLDGEELPVRGWIAYAKQSYRNEEMAGVRIYANKKLAVTVRDFGHKAGFTGEFTVRTYMVGVVHADWLDKEEDLIASDRQDIMWSSERGQALQEWGQELIKELGKKSFEPMRKKSFELFKERSNLERRAKERFGDTPVYDAAIEVGRRLAGGASEQNLKDEDYVRAMLELILSVAPHKIIVDKLRQIADEGNRNALEVISDLFGDAKLAEAASLGHVVEERIRVIHSLKKNIRASPYVDESEMQRMLESAPWLIDPQWTVLQANKTLKTFRSAFEGEHERLTGSKIKTTTLEGDATRPDFIMLSFGSTIEIVEIKRPKHALDSEDYDRLFGYIESLEKFLSENPEYKKTFSEIHTTLICDEIDLKRIDESSYNSLIKENKLQQINWEAVLLRTLHAHEDFITARDAFFQESSTRTGQQGAAS